MSEFDGSVWVTQDNDDLSLVCVNKRVKKKVQVLSERGREQSLSEDKLLWQLGSKARNEAEWPEVAARVGRMVGELRDSVDVPLLWETARELETSDLGELAELYFSGRIDAEHQVAIWLALAQDRLYFKRRGKVWEARTSEQVEEMLTQRRRENEREQLRETAARWLEQAVDAARVEVDETAAPFVERLECWMRGDRDKDVDTLVGELAEKRGVRPRELVFDILQKAGRIAADADRDIVVAGLKPEFSGPVSEAAAALQAWRPAPAQSVYEVDFSIDDADTREVDDALGITQDGDDWLVTVAVSDPAALIHTDDALDREAMRRGTTVYLPTQNVLMIPPRISCDLCSLNAGEVRSAILIQVRLDRQGNLRDSRIGREAVHVRRRLHYEDADRILQDGGDDDAETLRRFDALAQVLRAGREAEGAIGFNRPEYKIQVDGDQIQVKMIERDSPSRALVAEMMILANHVAARYAQRHEVPIIYRTQDPPEQPITSDMCRDTLGFQKVRKLLKPSALSLHPGQHSGLGLSLYTQFTSPLRRFADLVMQRQLVAHFNGEALPYVQEQLFQVLATAEQTAREARALEQAAKRRWFMLYLQQQHPDSVLDVLVMDNLKAGAKVELQPWGEEAYLSTSGKFAPGTVVQARLEKVRPKAGQIRLRPA